MRAQNTRIWAVDLSQPLRGDANPATLLTPDELARAARFAFPELRQRFIRGRAALRCVLGQQTGSDPAQLQFGYSDQGKPFLASPQPTESIGFNVSHSADRALIAISSAPSIGVDIEQMRSQRDLCDIARTFFASKEHACIASLSGPPQTDTFYRIWTRKEAVLKATGQGIIYGLNDPDVSARLDTAACEVPLRLEFRNRSWLLCDLCVAQGWAAAVAVGRA